METLKIDIINPKAKALLKDLADMNLIRISGQKSKTRLKDVISDIRSKQNESPDLDEITQEVEKVRSARYEK